jgi:hypothetical protein
MVEIACWRPMEILLTRYKELRGEECREEDVKKVREILMDNQAQGGPRDIAFMMGDIYRGAVEVCLNSDFGADDGPDLLASFNRRVICELGKCVI